MSLHASGQQTVGPYLHIGLDWLTTRDIAGRGIKGERVTVAGRLIDGDGAGVSDGLIEIWQANAAGKYAHPEDRQNKAARTRLARLRPHPDRCQGRLPLQHHQARPRAGPDGKLQAPHLVVAVFMRGLLKHLATRIYFPDEPANNEDPILKLVPVARRATLVARRKRQERAGVEHHPSGQERNGVLRLLSLELLFSDEVCAEAVSDEKLLAAMARFEGALARASARQGLVPAAHAEIISRVCERAQFDAAALAREGRTGTLAIPFVKQLTAQVAASRRKRRAMYTPAPPARTSSTPRPFSASSRPVRASQS